MLLLRHAHVGEGAEGAEEAKEAPTDLANWETRVALSWLGERGAVRLVICRGRAAAPARAPPSILERYLNSQVMRLGLQLLSDQPLLRLESRT